MNIYVQPESLASGSSPPAGFLCNNRCGKEDAAAADEESGSPAIAFDYIEKGLKLSPSSIHQLRSANREKLLQEKKLILILDLDETLIHSSHISGSAGKVINLPKPANFGSSRDDPDTDLFELRCGMRLTKLRPFVRRFLEEASSIFELYIYTLADRHYANEVAGILDPGKSYFGGGGGSGRVICRQDCTRPHQKRLDVVIGGDKRVAVIVDDKGSVWEKSNRCKNLIKIQKYNFPWINKDENKETDNALASVLDVLKLAHRMFYDMEGGAGGDVSSRDVRQVLKKMHKIGILSRKDTSFCIPSACSVPSDIQVNPSP